MVKNQETVIVNNEGKSRESNTRKSRKKRSTTIHATAIDPNAAAAAAASIMAQNATKAANEAVAKHPPTELEMSTHGGKFYTTTDPFGHILPVVYIANQPCPLNEYTLLASREEAATNNFDIIPKHVDNTVVKHQLWWYYKKGFNASNSVTETVKEQN